MKEWVKEFETTKGPKMKAEAVKATEAYKEGTKELDRLKRLLEDGSQSKSMPSEKEKRIIEKNTKKLDKMADKYYPKVGEAADFTWELHGSSILKSKKQTNDLIKSYSNHMFITQGNAQPMYDLMKTDAVKKKIKDIDKYEPINQDFTIAEVNRGSLPPHFVGHVEYMNLDNGNSFVISYDPLKAVGRIGYSKNSLNNSISDVNKDTNVWTNPNNAVGGKLEVTRKQVAEQRKTGNKGTWNNESNAKYVNENGLSNEWKDTKHGNYSYREKAVKDKDGYYTTFIIDKHNPDGERSMKVLEKNFEEIKRTAPRYYVEHNYDWLIKENPELKKKSKSEIANMFKVAAISDNGEVSLEGSKESGWQWAIPYVSFNTNPKDGKVRPMYTGTDD